MSRPDGTDIFLPASISARNGGDEMVKEFLKRFESTESLISLALGLAVVVVVAVLGVKYFENRHPGNTAGVTGGASTSAASEVPPKEPTKYTVRAGDTLWSIADTYYTSGYNWVDIAKANTLADANHIETGESLIIPVATPIMPESAVQTGTAGQQIAASHFEVNTKETTYTVSRGDSLWDIAASHYGTGYRWTDIAKANTLANPDLIFAGNVLTLPQ
ncbi:LysM peptidoglycan-binding domain-containing protein [Patescibacteria group bacterium]|nr:LysM peptidoglycan-binding domain-containing protein [Patescibacteria group bacterium]